MQPDGRLLLRDTLSRWTLQQGPDGKLRLPEEKIVELTRQKLLDVIDPFNQYLATLTSHSLLDLQLDLDQKERDLIAEHHPEAASDHIGMIGGYRGAGGELSEILN